MFEMIKNYLPTIKNLIVNNAKTISKCVKTGSNKLETFVNKHNIPALILLCVIIYFFAKLLIVSIIMYQTYKNVDSNWVIIVTAVVGLVTIYATSFSNNMTKQNINNQDNKAKVMINESNNQVELGKKWIDKNGDGIMQDDEVVDESNADNYCENLDLI